jgi:hypothetical protein
VPSEQRRQNLPEADILTIATEVKEDSEKEFRSPWITFSSAISVCSVVKSILLEEAEMG